MADEFNASQSAGTFSSRQQVKDNRGNVVGNLIQQASFEIGQLTIYQGQVTQVPDSGREKTTEHKAIAPNPYKGLAAFQETDGDRFFGREQHILTLWRQLRDLFEVEGAIRLLPIYGPSGSGKSSLARAGLIPVLARQPLPGYEQARVAVLTPGTHPLESLAAVLARIATQDLTPIGKAAEFAEALKRRDEKGDYDGLRRIADILPEITASPLIVVVDQFEEVYSLCKDAVERAAFVENLLTAAAERTRRVAVIITLRSDFLEETQQSGTLNKVFSKQGFLVPMMDRSELRQAIAVPAELAGYGFDEATIGLLIEQAEGREGALPLLQFALTRIWEG
ncbi:MAG: ATP-binding protein, partial [Cyanobacteria bacterium P01_F01_bin.53]